MAAGNFIVYDSAKALIGGGLDLANATLKMMLLDDTHTPNRATQADYADVSGDELANGDGYTTGGATLSNVTYTQTSGTAKFTFDPVEWTASGDGLADVRYAVIYVDDGADDALLAYCALESTALNIADTQKLRVTPHANGALSLAGATS